MIERRCGAGFLLETPGAVGGNELGREDLEGDGPLQA